jgi:pyruvate dehydrogenase E2 component (dihydrolipoamide acetyltransferase)
MSHAFLLPDIGEGLTDAEVVEWFVSVGDEVDVDQPIVEIETAKTSVEITSTHAGVVLHLGGNPGDTINVGEVLFVVGDEDEEYRVRSEGTPAHHTPSAIGLRPSQEDPSTQAVTAARPKAMPVVRRLATKLGVDLATITGTGSGGAITRNDVERAAATTPAETLTPLTRTRRAIARHMTESWTTIPHVTVQADIRAENLLAARHGDNAEPLPLEALVGVAVLPLLARYRQFNSSMHQDVVEHKDRYNLGFAVDTEAGLMVVVVKDADRLSLGALAQEFERLAAAAIAGTLTPDEATGQTFTISNIGALGGGHGTPIIPLGTSAILSVGRAKQSPVVEDGKLGVGVMAPIDLSYDHRLIDGSLGQRFLSDLVDALQEM